MKKQLPLRPHLEQLRKQAKALLSGFRTKSPEALTRIRESHPQWRDGESRFTLAAAQLVVAREYGFESWPRLKVHVEGLRAAPPVAPTLDAAIRTLQDAAGRGDLARISSLLDANASLINEVAGPGVRTALHHAVFGSSEASVKLLLERGADPNIRCEGDNAYPLHFAAEKKNFPIIRLLVEHGGDVIGEGDYHELGVIGWATAWEYVQPDGEIVEYLLAHGARHNISSAVAVGNTDAIRRIVADFPSDLEKRMDMANRRRRPLHLAVIKKQADSLATLLYLGAKTESLDEAGFTALDQAALMGETALAERLLERGAKVRLPAAVALGRTGDIQKLLHRDPDALRPGGRWENLILRAAERAPGAVIDTLIQAGASVDVRDDPKTAVDSTFGYTPLHAAAFNGNLSAAAALLKHGANVRTREEKYHGTPAGWANYAGHTAVRDLILQGPVDIMEAVESLLADRVIAILQEDPGAINRPFREYPLYPMYAEGWHTPLAFAVARGHADMVRLLLENGADSRVRSADGKTLEQIAQESGHPEIAEAITEPNNPPAL